MEEKKKTCKGAIWSLLLGLLFWFPLLNFIFGALAVYLGFESLKNGKGQRMGAARAFAVGGILLGALPFYFGLMAILKTALNLEATMLAEIGFFATPALLAALLITLKAKRLL